jgi:hypothetical protein
VARRKRLQQQHCSNPTGQGLALQPNYYERQTIFNPKTKIIHKFGKKLSKELKNESVAVCKQ